MKKWLSTWISAALCFHHMLIELSDSLCSFSILLMLGHCYDALVLCVFRGSSVKRSSGMERSQSSTWDSSEDNKNKLVKAASTSKLLAKVVKNTERCVHQPEKSNLRAANSPEDMHKRQWIKVSILIDLWCVRPIRYSGVWDIELSRSVSETNRCGGARVAHLSKVNAQIKGDTGNWQDAEYWSGR